MRCEQIRELDFAVEGIHIVAILVDFVIGHRCHDVANLQPGFHRRRVRFDTRHVNAAAVASFSGKLPQLRIAGWEK